MQEFLIRTISGLTNGSVYAMVALALVIVFRGTGTLNFAQGEMALFTTYVGWWVTTRGLPVWVALIVAVILGFVLAAAVERILITPVAKKNESGTLIIAMGLFIAFNGLAGFLFGDASKTMPSMFPNDLQSDFISIGGARLYYDAIGVWVATTVLVVMVFFLFNRTRLGLQMRSVANNAESARLCGIPAGRIKMFSWALAGAVAAVAGVLFAPFSSDQLSLTTMFAVFIYGASAALFGGLNSTSGAVAGGIIFGLLQAYIAGYVGFIGGELQQTGALAVIVLVLLLRPTGLFGTKVTERV